MCVGGVVVTFLWATVIMSLQWGQISYPESRVSVAGFWCLIPKGQAPSKTDHFCARAVPGKCLMPLCTTGDPAAVTSQGKKSKSEQTEYADGPECAFLWAEDILVCLSSSLF